MTYSKKGGILVKKRNIGYYSTPHKHVLNKYRKMTALLIEDNLIFQIKLRNIMNSLGYEVVTVSSIKETVTSFKAATFDLLICDIVLSDGEFFDINTVPNVPTIFITAYENPAYMEKALKINNALFIVKPFSDLSFIAAVKHLSGSSKNIQDTVTVFGKHKNPIDIDVNEIEAIKSEGNYSLIFTVNGDKHVVKRSAKKIIESLNNPVFARIRRSTYINKSKIAHVSLSENKVSTISKEFAVSKNFKNNIYEFYHLDK